MEQRAGGRGVGVAAGQGAGARARGSSSAGRRGGLGLRGATCAAVVETRARRNHPPTSGAPGLRAAQGVPAPAQPIRAAVVVRGHCAGMVGWVAVGDANERLSRGQGGQKKGRPNRCRPHQLQPGRYPRISPGYSLGNSAVCLQSRWGRQENQRAGPQRIARRTQSGHSRGESGAFRALESVSKSGQIATSFHGRNRPSTRT